MAKLWNWDSKEKAFVSDDGDYLAFDEFIMYVNGLERMAKGALEAWDKATDGQKSYHRMDIWQREYRNLQFIAKEARRLAEMLEEKAKEDTE